jgi:ribosomal protein S18 acetylase RimI-like enzyme
MLNPDHFQAMPWDRAVFGVPCFEITRPDEAALSKASCTPGHYTVKVDPLADASALERHGFYYTGSLISPRCDQAHFAAHAHPDVSVDAHVQLSEILPMCDNSFDHGRFHRDFNLPAEAATRRYKQWLAQLHAANSVIGLRYQQQTAAFIAHNDGSLLLHAMQADFRGQGLAKYLWSAAIQDIFSQGAREIRSSISPVNLAALNLYASLGFRFDGAQDVYHRLTR